MGKIYTQMKPHTSFIVCATQRSGSSLLCEALWNTGLAGRPDEYFLPDTEKDYSEIWETSTYVEYFDRVIEEGTTPNGVFGAKIMWDQVGYFKKKVLEIPRYAHLKTSDLMGSIFPNLHYIWIARRDKVRQAVSFWKRIQTGIHSWYEDEPPRYTKTLEFDFVEIDRLVHKFHQSDLYWQSYFRTIGVSPFRVIYEEDLEQGYEDVIKRILAYLAVMIPDGLTFQAERRKQGDELSEMFVRLYHDTVQRKKE